MGLINVEQATKDFEEKLQSGFFSSMREDAHRLAKMYEPKEDYSDKKEDRDTKAVIDFANSSEFKQLVDSL